MVRIPLNFVQKKEEIPTQKCKYNDKMKAVPKPQGMKITLDGLKGIDQSIKEVESNGIKQPRQLKVL